MVRQAAAVCVLLGIAGIGYALPDGMVMIDLKWADAPSVVAMLSDEPGPDEDELRALRQQWVDDFASDLARDLPEELDDRWYYAASMVTAPRERLYAQESSLANLLPAGLDGPPTALPNRNALLVSGTPAAIDQLRELIAMIDVKPRMVNVDVRLEDAPVTTTDEWGIETAQRFGDLIIGLGGPAPTQGPQVRWRRGDTSVTGGWNRSQDRAQTVTGANVTTTNNIPAIITVGRLFPFVSGRAYWGPNRERIVETSVDAIFIGTELFVQPRINADDTITMFLQPTFIDSAGTVTGPYGMQLPITQTVGVVTQVTVSDGETMQIGGFERSLDEYNTQFRGLLRDRRVTVDSHPRMYVTPRIIRDLDEGRR